MHKSMQKRMECIEMARFSSYSNKSIGYYRRMMMNPVDLTFRIYVHAANYD